MSHTSFCWSMICARKLSCCVCPLCFCITATLSLFLILFPSLENITTNIAIGLIHRSVGPYSVLGSYPIVSAHCAFASRPHYHYWLCSKNSAIAMVGEAPSERSKQTTDVRVQHGRQNGLKSILKEYLWTLKSSSFLRFNVTNNPFCFAY